MEFKKVIITLVITLVVIFTGALGSSYAYYTVSDTEINITTGNESNGILVTFAENNYVNIKTGVPIDNADVDTLVKPSTFTIIPDSTILGSSDAIVNISLINVNIDEMLKVSDFKYKLECTPTGESKVTLSSGTGTSITGNTLSLGTLSTLNSTLNINKSYDCNFRVWIANSENNQNELMNKSFSGLIKVNVISKGK